MEPLVGTITLWAALVSAAGSVVLSVLQMKGASSTLRRYSFYLEACSFAILTISLLLLTYAFLITDLGIHNVWLLTDKDLEPQYKFSAMWSGVDGSIFVWGYLILAAVFANDLIRKLKGKDGDAEGAGKVQAPDRFCESGHAKRKGRHTAKDNAASDGEAGDARYSDLARAVALSICAIFLFIIIVNDPFAATHPYEATADDGTTATIDPSDFPDGIGLKPELKNPWMMIHPPVVFLAYAAIIISFASAVTSFLKRDDLWLATARPWSRLAWLLLTIGIGMGAIWAYTVVKWGGYWSWDPKETSAFIIWISLSAFIIAQNGYHRNPLLKRAAPILGIATFALMLFGTFVTRSGLWSAVPIEMKSASSYLFVALIAAVLVVGSILVAWSKKKAEEGGGGGPAEAAGARPDKGGSGRKKAKKKGLDTDEDGGAMDAGNLVENTILVICCFLALMLFGILLRSMDLSYSSTYFEAMFYPALVTLLVLIGIYLLKGLLAKRTLAIITSATLGAGLLAGAAMPLLLSGGGRSFLLFIGKASAFGFLLPILAFVAFAAAFCAARRFDRRAMRASLRRIFACAAVLGVVLILGGYGAGSTWSESTTGLVSVNGTSAIAGEEITFTHVSYDFNGTHVEFEFEVTVSGDGGQEHSGVLKWEYYLDRGDAVPTPLIVRGVMQDVYISVTDVDPDGNGTLDFVTLNVRHIPLLALVWVGFGMMTAGMAVWYVLDIVDDSGSAKGPVRENSKGEPADNGNERCKEREARSGRKRGTEKVRK